MQIAGLATITAVLVLGIFLGLKIVAQLEGR